MRHMLLLVVLLLVTAANSLIMAYALSPLLEAIFPENAHVNGASVIGAAATFGEHVQLLLL